MPNRKKTKARILVVLPTLGQRSDLLKKTLESIKAQLPVSYDIAMIYPLDSKPTSKLADEYNAVKLADPGGLSAALNTGISSAKAHHEYIAWIGDDDLIAPNSLATTLDALDTNPDAVVAYGYCDYIDSDGNKIFTSRAGSIAPWLMTWGPNLLPVPGALFRRSALKLAGDFDVNNKYSMDLDMFLRLRKIGKFINTRSVLASFRWHVDSTTVANRDKVLKETKIVKRRYLPRYLLAIAPLWEVPVDIATKIAAKRVNASGSRKVS